MVGNGRGVGSPGIESIKMLPAERKSKSKKARRRLRRIPVKDTSPWAAQAAAARAKGAVLVVPRDTVPLGCAPRPRPRHPSRGLRGRWTMNHFGAAPRNQSDAERERQRLDARLAAEVDAFVGPRAAARAAGVRDSNDGC